MNIVVMQPYSFPYIGYFQLIYAADVFVFYDDVNFIKQGWINRNRILVNGEAHTFTIPVEQISSFKKINETALSAKYNAWVIKFLKTLKLEYGKSPEFEAVYPLISELLIAKHETIAQLAIESTKAIAHYIGLERTFRVSSQAYQNQHLERADRLIDITRCEGGNCYINASGGSELYDKEYFLNNGIELKFLLPEIKPYKQGKFNFVPGLSIIDVLMNVNKDEVRNFLIPKYQLK